MTAKLTRRAFALAATGLALLQGGVTATYAQDNVELNWALWDFASAPYYQPLIDAYQAAHPNVTINYTDLGSTDYNQVLMTQLTGGGSDIDVITIKDIPGYAQLINANVLVDLNAALPEKVSPEGYGGMLDALTVDGKLYGLPFRSDFWIVYYNKGLFDKAGVDYPTNDMTWDEYDELARKMTSGFGADKVYGSHFHVWRSTVELPGILDGKQTLADGSYEFLKPWYERALKLQEDGIVMDYGTLKTSKTHYSGPFYNQQIAMLPMGSWFIGTQIAKVESGESLATEWGIVQFPHAEGVAAGSTAAQVTSLAVNANSAKKDAAMDFVKWVSGAEAAQIIAATGTIPALRNDAIIATIAQRDGFPTDQASAEALVVTKGYLEMPVSLKAADIDQALNPQHDAIMTGSTSVDDALAAMDAGVAALQ